MNKTLLQPHGDRNLHFTARQMRGGRGAELFFMGPNGPGRELFLGGGAILLMFLLVVNATFGIR